MIRSRTTNLSDVRVTWNTRTYSAFFYLGVSVKCVSVEFGNRIPKTIYHNFASLASHLKLISMS